MVDGTGVIQEDRAQGTTERVALVVYHMLEGAEMSTAEVATMAGVTWQGAEQMLERASRVVPITKYQSRWRRG